MRIKIITFVFAFMAFSAWSQCCGKKTDGCAKKSSANKEAASKCTSCKSDTACKTCSSKHTIDTAALKKAIDGKDKLIILDARSKDDGRRIPGAKKLTSSADAKTVKAVAGDDKNAKIITYCGSLQCGASAKLAKTLRKAGYTNVIEYPPGIAGWTEAGNPVSVEKK